MRQSEGVLRSGVAANRTCWTLPCWTLPLGVARVSELVGVLTFGPRRRATNRAAAPGSAAVAPSILSLMALELMIA